MNPTCPTLDALTESRRRVLATISHDPKFRAFLMSPAGADHLTDLAANDRARSLVPVPARRRICVNPALVAALKDPDDRPADQK